MLVDIDIIMWVLVKKSHIKFLEIGEERPKLEVPMQAL